MKEKEREDWPPEALLLAALHQLGRLAGDFLSRSGLTPDTVSGRAGPQASPTEALRQLIQHLEASCGRSGITGGRTGRMEEERQGTVEPREPGGRRPVRAGDGAELTRERMERVGRAGEVARLLQAYWLEQPAPPTLERYGEDVDVSTPQGRWELLALAVLLGAPVPRHRVEDTFCTLRRHGLLDLEEVAAAQAHWVQAVDEILAVLYRGPVRRSAQRERLVRAARRLLDRFGGDLQGLWDGADGDPGRCRGLLRESFDGVDRVASWVLREMGRKGAWPGAHRHPAALYVDAHVRRVLENLELLDASGTPQEAERLVHAAFGGDGTALFYHGRERCGRRSLAVCLKHCPVSRFCAQLRRWAAWGEGPGRRGQNRETPAKRPAGARQVLSEPAGGAAIS